MSSNPLTMFSIYRVHVSTQNAVDQLSGQPGMHQHHGKQQISAAVEERYQASLIAAYVVLISKLTMQGSAGTVQQDGSCSCHE